MVVCILFLGMTSSVFAANKKLIDQVHKEYVKYEKTTTKNYISYKKKEKATYETYTKKESASYKSYVNQTKQDIENLNQMLNQDVKRLEILYGGNTEYTTKLRDYKNSINPIILEVLCKSMRIVLIQTILIV